MLQRISVKRKVRGTSKGAEALTFGQRLREVRGFKVSQEEFARRIGVSQGQLSRYERGLMMPAADVLVRIKEEFGVSIDWLLTGEDAP